MAGQHYWIWLSTVGPKQNRQHELLRYFGSPAEVYHAKPERYSQLPGLSETDRARMARKDMTQTGEILDLCRDKGIHIVTWQDSAYPELLRDLPDAPLVLYLRGQLPPLEDKLPVSVVGTRQCSDYAVRAAHRLGMEICVAGGCLVTGMAAGVDGAAARGALEAGGSCIGVLGTAIDVDYPRANEGLIRQTAARAAILSEYPPGHNTQRWNFAERDRLISAMSRATVVVEAPARSGALITAGQAVKQGRRLYAVPAETASEINEGSRRLLETGVSPVTDGYELLRELRSSYPSRITIPRRPEPAAAAPQPETPIQGPKAKKEQNGIDKPTPIPYIDVESRMVGLDEQQKAILRYMAESGEATVDELVVATGIRPGPLLALMTRLTLKKLVRSQPGSRYILIMDNNKE